MSSAVQPDLDAFRAALDFYDQVSTEYPIVEARVFGSYARGEASAGSDLDLAFILRGRKGQAAEIGPEMAARGYEVMLESGLVISPLPIWEEDWRDPEGHSNPWLVRAVQREGIRLER